MDRVDSMQSKTINQHDLTNLKTSFEQMIISNSQKMLDKYQKLDSRVDEIEAMNQKVDGISDGSFVNTYSQVSVPLSATVKKDGK